MFLSLNQYFNFKNITLLLIVFICCLNFSQGLIVEAANNFSSEVVELDAKNSVTELIKYLVQWAFRLAGLFAFIMIIYAGFQYLTAGGNVEQQKEAQERIINTFIGIVLLFSFWLILNQINPNILGKPEPVYVPTLEQEKQDIRQEIQTQVVKNLVLVNGILPLSSDLQSRGHQYYLNATLVNKLKVLNNGTWVVTDACIDSSCSATTHTPRKSNDCHLQGTCVDIGARGPTNLDLVPTFTNAGLNVLYEGNHLHVTLKNASGYGTYAGKINISEGTWYLGI